MIHGSLLSSVRERQAFPGNPPGPDLALAQRDGTHFLREMHGVSKLVEVSSRVSARRQDENEGSAGG